MAAIATQIITPIAPPKVRRADQDTLLVRSVLIGITVFFFVAVLVTPLILIFVEAFAKGVEVYLKSFDDYATRKAIWLTLTIAAIAVPANTIFGLAAAWCVSRYDFRGKQLLNTLIDLPLWISPVVSGMVYIFVFGQQGWFGDWLIHPVISIPWGWSADMIYFPSTAGWLAHPFMPIPELTGGRHWIWHTVWESKTPIRVIFATPGIVLATIFVTFPFVARGLIPLMQAQGKVEEEVAMTLGANGWQVFYRITLPKIRWGLIYGMILCNARAMGEFGAVSVVSGHIRGSTVTVPLQVEILYNEFGSYAAAFAVASLLSLLGLVTLGLKSTIEWRNRRALEHSNA